MPMPPSRRPMPPGPPGPGGPSSGPRPGGPPGGRPPGPPGPPVPGGPGVPPGPGGPGVDPAAMQQQEDAAKLDAVAATAPAPEKPYSVPRIKSFSEQLDKTADALMATDVPIPSWPPEGGEQSGGGKWDQPLPPEVYAPYFVIHEAVKDLSSAHGGAFDKYLDVAPESLTNDTALNQAIARLKSMEKDKKLKEAIGQAIQGGPPPEEKPRPKGAKQMSDDDKVLAENL